MGAARLVETGVTGIVVEPASVPELVEAIRLLVTRDDLRAEYGANARRRAADFTYSKVARGGATSCSSRSVGATADPAD